MRRVLVLFGSKSNRKVYGRVISELKRLNVDFDFRIASAHKTPAEVDGIIDGDYCAIIAGAGMAAHLAGVVASKTLIPVIGVPCGDNFSGLDALLSTLQMPPGIPVLSVGVDRAEDAALAASRIVDSPKKVSVLVKGGFAEKAADILQILGVKYELSYGLQEDAINLRFVELDNVSEAADDSCFVINCPIAENASAEESLQLLKINSGLWVSLNRPDNSALAAASVLERKDAVADYRKEIAAAVLKADSEERIVAESSPSLKAVIFDLDGVLIDSEPIHYESFRHVFEKQGKPYSKGHHDSYKGKSSAEIFSDFLKVGGENEIKQLRQDRRKVYLSIADNELKLFPGALSLLKELKAVGLKIGLATSSGRANVDFFFDKFKLDGFFDACVTGDDVKKIKPDPEIFLKAAEKLGVERSDCVVIEDSFHGVDAALAAGMKCIIVSPGKANLAVSGLEKVNFELLRGLFK